LPSFSDQTAFEHLSNCQVNRMKKIFMNHDCILIVILYVSQIAIFFHQYSNESLKLKKSFNKEKSWII